MSESKSVMICVQLPPVLIGRLDRHSAKTGNSRSGTIRYALFRFLNDELSHRNDSNLPIEAELTRQGLARQGDTELAIARQAEGD